MAIDSRPRIFKTQIASPKPKRLVDAYTGAVRELFFVRNPKFRKQTPDGEAAYQAFLKVTPVLEDAWIFYPDTEILVHTLAENLYFELRTARNRNIVTAKEQNMYRETVVGIAGLSVGSSALHALVQSGGPKTIKIADFDTLEISNLNRIRARLTDIGTNKTFVAAREAWSLDPFLDLDLRPEGINEINLEAFIADSPRVQIFIDQMDNFKLKFLSRNVCRAARIPVIMATDNGDSVILDVERFDEDPARLPLHGAIKDIKLQQLDNLNADDWLKIALKVVGQEYLNTRMKTSIKEIGKTLSSIPQFGPTASIAGAAIAFAVRKIATKQALQSGRYVIDLEKNFL